MQENVYVSTTLNTLGISSLWGAIFGGYHFRGVVIFGEQKCYIKLVRLGSSSSLNLYSFHMGELFMYKGVVSGRQEN